MELFFVYVTAASEAEALRISHCVVEERLAACANLLGGMKSVYWWDSRVCEGEEVVLVLKTSAERKAELIDRVTQLHSYECPCVVCLPIAGGHPGFLQWMADETARKA